MGIERVDYREGLKRRRRREPYWQRISEGRYVGFRIMEGSKEGTWVARFYDGEGYKHKSLGDFAELSEKERYSAAVNAAGAWFSHLGAGGSTEKMTVKQACEAYVQSVRMGKDSRSRRHVRPNAEATANDLDARYKRLVYNDPIARFDLAKLKQKHVEAWTDRVRSGVNSIRTYNRNLSALRAALNEALRRKHVTSALEWSESLKPLKDDGKRRDLCLTPEQRGKLIKHSSEEVKPFLQALNMLPIRPGELAALKVEYLKPEERCLKIPTGKAEARTIPLPDRVLAHFKQCAKSKLPSAWLVARADGGQWKKEAWRDEIKLAAAAAKLPRATVAYTLRHSIITDLVKGGLDIFHVAKLAGTSVAMIEKHYGHLQHDRARQALDNLALA